jgi:hypothetical protein
MRPSLTVRVLPECRCFYFDTYVSVNVDGFTIPSTSSVISWSPEFRGLVVMAGYLNKILAKARSNFGL